MNLKEKKLPRARISRKGKGSREGTREPGREGEKGKRGIAEAKRLLGQISTGETAYKYP